MSAALPVVWTAPLLLTPAGYGDEARTAVLSLDAAGVDVRVDPMGWDPWQVSLASGVAERLERLLAIETPARFVHVVHSIPHLLYRHPAAVRAIARTMFEADPLPPAFVPLIDAMDEVWVPSAFNAEMFARAGVTPEKVRKVPMAIDRGLYERQAPPLELPSASGFVFLCVSTWGRRKGWDVLVRAYLEEFGANEEVTLLLGVRPTRFVQARASSQSTLAVEQAELTRFVREELGRELSAGPRLVLFPLALSDVEMPRLYAAADAYVMPSRGEGWGRPFMEAMACGLPTIGTRWSGQLEFMNDENSYLVDCEVVDVPEIAWGELERFSGHRWAEPSVTHLRQLMRRVFTDQGEARRLGKRARAEVLERFSGGSLAEQILERISASGFDIARRPSRRPVRHAVVWEGEQFAGHSLAIMNRGLCRALIGTGRVDLVVRSEEPPAGALDHSLSALVARRTRLVRRPDAHVRGSSPTLEVPAAGRLVLWQPWGWGSVPTIWLERLGHGIDEVWAMSRHERDGWMRSGADADRVAVVPSGVDPLRFHPYGRPLALPTRNPFRFLFVGHAIPRKGVDLLVRAYLESFGPADPVCLVVKDTRPASPHRHPRIREELIRLQDDPEAPELLYLDSPLAPDAMASLYAACNCLVQPSRAEAFLLPPLEAMACGLPVIVPAYGGWVDYADPTVAYLVPAHERRLDEPRVWGYETVDRGWFCEVDVAALAAAMRHVFEHQEEAREVGRRASVKARTDFTWARSADVAMARLDALAQRRRRRQRPRKAARLSVCVIARDEERFIGACLESVRGLAAQLVVVDTGSLDQTAEIARSAGAEVYQFDWRDDFAAARNESLRHARSPWILVLDADETLETSSRDEVRRLTDGDELLGYLLSTRNYSETEGRDVYVEHLNLRLFPNHPALRFVGRDPHAQLRALRADLPFRQEPAQVVLHHEGYRPQHLADGEKLERNRRALERSVRELPDDPFNAYNLGRTYVLLGREADARRELARAIVLGEAQPHVEYPSYLLGAQLSLALTLFRQRRFRDALAWCERALVVAPDYADAHVTRAASLASLGDLDGALDAYERALACSDKASRVATDRSASGRKALLGMAEVYRIQGREPEARTCLERAGSA